MDQWSSPLDLSTRMRCRILRALLTASLPSPRVYIQKWGAEWGGATSEIPPVSRDKRGTPAFSSTGRFRAPGKGAWRLPLSLIGTFSGRKERAITSPFLWKATIRRLSGQALVSRSHEPQRDQLGRVSREIRSQAIVGENDDG